MLFRAIKFISNSFLSENLKPPNIRKLDLSLDPNKKEERDNQARAAIRHYDENFGKIDLERSYPALFELLWYGQMPCTDVRGITSEVKDELSFLKKCYWKGMEIACNSIFQKRPTDKGLCCSFNMEKAENILKDSKYREAVILRQMEDTNNGFEVGEKPNWYIENDEPTPEAGRKKGLTLIVDGHSDRLSAATVSDNFRGFPIVVDDNDKFPMVALSELIARPGFESNIKVNAFHLDALDETRKYGPDKRKCYFPDEYQLKMHKYYSQTNCVFECELEFASKCLTTCNEFGKECNCKNLHFQNEYVNGSNLCVPWFYPSHGIQSTKICNPWNTQKFREILSKQIPIGQCKYCLPDCTTTIYDTSVSYAELRKCDRTTIGSTSILCDLVNGVINPAPWVHNAQKEYEIANQSVPWYLETSSNGGYRSRFTDKRNNLKARDTADGLIFTSVLKDAPTYDAFEKDIGIINIFFKEKKIMKYETANRMSFFDFLSQIGGSLGLVMGISIISIVEIIYWFTFRLLSNLGKIHFPPFNNSLKNA